MLNAKYNHCVDFMGEDYHHTIYGINTGVLQFGNRSYSHAMACTDRDCRTE